MSRFKFLVTDVRVERVEYYAREGRCIGTNVMYKVGGKPRSSRLPWVETVEGATARILEQVAREIQDEG